MRVLVTGGGGFLGAAVCASLTDAGHEVSSFARSTHTALASLGVLQFQGDLRDEQAVSGAVAGHEAVVHCAAKAGTWGPEREFYETNVLGTRNVISACREHGVRRLVHTSSPSVVHCGEDLDGVDESAPYATRFSSAYPRTKAEAERTVLGANSPELATVALRPHLIWGPGDPHFVPRVMAAAKAGRLRLLGAADKRIDTVYVDNAAEAHLLALERLQPGSPIAGRAYFITQDNPQSTEDTLAALLWAVGLPPETRRVPRGLAKGAASALEFAYRALRVRAEPPLTRLVIDHLGTAHWFDISAARRDLAYFPRVSSTRGLLRLRASLAPVMQAPARTPPTK
ncbi:NAD-dependent epimerase/dehydratase family protein [Allokutzneria sp. A3M-2-11 16]|uniref:NAD-dependent epimerase/dehydratase family protein n=1 Tax=Allokutzneria sp. A3M-2-11 16 TaxID=2962043 RepID=UPI0020B88005|nr:NAD-dependent epimerase/dehydratase family protein [Allokutzneria sp. A3M-2-11 16]MCP3803288.1 NAD-dependent epimerase/dehydratase family protein [Allokutzneria sp. A3M-2-11 16]